MKIRLVAILAGLAISFAVPTFAQQRDLLGVPDALEIFGEISQKLNESYNNNGAAAAAALFTEDGVLVEPDGMASGRPAIEKRYADTFQRWPISDFLSRRDRYRLNAIDNAVWSAGEWLSNKFAYSSEVRQDQCGNFYCFAGRCNKLPKR